MDLDLEDAHLSPWVKQLHRACERGDIDSVRSLLASSDADDLALDAAAYDGTNALMLASAAGSLPCVRALVGAKADLAYSDDKGFGAITVACYCGHVDVARFLLCRPEYEAPPTEHYPLLAAATKSLQLVRMLVEEFKEDVDQAGARGFTALMMAAQSGRPDIVRYLVAHGASVSKRNAAGQTVYDISVVQLDVAVQSQHLSSSLPDSQQPDSIRKAVREAIQNGRQDLLRKETPTSLSSTLAACQGRVPVAASTPVASPARTPSPGDDISVGDAVKPPTSQRECRQCDMWFW